ncbi:MAG: LptF/LptG family permease [Aestuariivirga sp.]|uniref:LptF/LptG family permease n=1 Tax=Aestuariivirga sp. TaxID=2650926 RepID=UPI0025C38C50|nr:LptF/LptG family permease [Aestuariivirga sp.]MCA3559856.1 LptF/LptG family permease [Aestuariivirga sp.]
MMKILGWMLNRMVAIRFFGILLGISFFVLSLDVLTNAKDLQALRPGDMTILLKYMLYRAPGVLVNYMGISMLLAMLLSLTELSYRNEMAAMWAAGVSPGRLIAMLLPLAFLAGGINFVLSDSAIPATTPQLRDWGIGDYGVEKLKMGEKDPIWMRAGPDILRAAGANADSTKLDNVIIFRRDGQGLLHEQIYARSAELADGRWTLTGVLVYYRDNLQPSRLAALVYSGNMKPAQAGARSGAPEDMALTELLYFIDNQGFGIRPVWVYQTWANKRISLFFSSLLMMGLCIPLATRFRRGGGLGALFAVGVGLGFVYFIVDGIALTMGELGFVKPWLAAWLPILAFGSLAVVMTLRSETV